MHVFADYVVQAVLAFCTQWINRQSMHIAEQIRTFGPDVSDRRALIGPHANPEMAFLPRPVILPVIDVSLVNAAGCFHARRETSSFARSHQRLIFTTMTSRRTGGVQPPIQDTSQSPKREPSATGV